MNNINIFSNNIPRNILHHAAQGTLSIPQKTYNVININSSLVQDMTKFFTKEFIYTALKISFFVIVGGLCLFAAIYIILKINRQFRIIKKDDLEKKNNENTDSKEKEIIKEDNDDLIKSTDPIEPQGSLPYNIKENEQIIVTEHMNEIAVLVSKFNTFISNQKETISFQQVEELRSIKKESKKFLKESNSEINKENLNKIILSYKNMMNDIEVFNVLKNIKNEIESKTDKRNWVCGFANLISDEKNQVDDLNTDKVRWDNVRKKMWNAAVNSQNFLSQNKKITWITGSNSTCIPSIMRVPKTSLSGLTDKPALVPTGMLLSHNIVPLYGELEMGIFARGVNNIALSGCSLMHNYCGLNINLDTCINYASNKKFKFNEDNELKEIEKIIDKEYLGALSSLKVAVLKLLMTGSKKNKYDEIVKNLKKLLDKLPKSLPLGDQWEKYTPFIGDVCTSTIKSNVNTFQRGQLVSIPRSNSQKNKYGVIKEIITAEKSCKVIIEKNGIEKTINWTEIETISKDSLDDLIKSQDKGLQTMELGYLRQQMRSSREEIDDIISLFDTVKPINYSEEEKNLMDHSFPIVWTSTSINPEPFYHGSPGEQIVKGIAKLGDDIQVVFTPEKNVERLKKAVNGLGVEVLNFDCAHYITGLEYMKKC